MPSLSEFFAGELPRKFAHRGASGTHPENTMEAFRAGLEGGAEGFELDVHRSADGHIVVFHDDVLDRTTDGSGPIRERSLAELRELDAGFRFSPDGGRSFPFRGSGIRIPALRDVLEAFPDTPLIIEVKQVLPALEQDLARLLRETGRGDALWCSRWSRLPSRGTVISSRNSRPASGLRTWRSSCVVSAPMRGTISVHQRWRSRCRLHGMEPRS